MKFFIVSSEFTAYAADHWEASDKAGSRPWNRATLANAIRQLELGDELSVDSDVSVFRISGKDIDYKG